jgi:hypothetical protein
MTVVLDELISESRGKGFGFGFMTVVLDEFAFRVER